MKAICAELRAALEYMIELHADYRINLTPWFTLYTNDCWNVTIALERQHLWWHD
jgi:hypothetical protein